MFGPERSGLTNEDVAFADTIISIPTFKKFSSLNLAQAVNIVCFEIWKRQQELTETNAPELWLQPRDGQRYAKKEELLAFFDRMESKLDERSFQVDDNRRILLYRNLRNIFQRVSLTKSDSVIWSELLIPPLVPLVSLVSLPLLSLVPLPLVSSIISIIIILNIISISTSFYLHQ